MMVIEMIEETFNQPFKTGPLIDQQGNYALFDILMNRQMFDYIKQHKLYSKAEQLNAANSNLRIDFPAGTNPPDGQVESGDLGGIIIKVSWKILDSDAEKRKFHTVDALVSMPRHDPNTEPQCLRKTLGLIGFHVMHKTKSRLQWIWTSFEHVDNVPEQKEVDTRKLKPSYSFYNPRLQCCDLQSERDAAATVGSGAIARIEIPQSIQEPDRSRHSVDGRYEEDEQAIPGHPQRHGLGKLHAAQYPMAE
jgi:hypothetical protein